MATRASCTVRFPRGKSVLPDFDQNCSTRVPTRCSGCAWCGFGAENTRAQGFQCFALRVFNVGSAILNSQTSPLQPANIVHFLELHCLQLQRGPTAGTVQARHGAVEAVASLVEVLQDKVTSENQTAIRNLVPALEKARAYRGRGGEVVRQAACRLLQKIAATPWPFKDATAVRYLQTVDECARHTTEAIRVVAAEALGVLAATRFKPELCTKCVETYLGGLQKADETIAARRGYTLCLGAMPLSALAERRADVLAALCKEVQGGPLPGGKDQEDPTTRQYAVLSLGCLCIGAALSSEEISLLLSALEAAMGDYATDRRGDVGSWVREAAMEVIVAILEAQRLQDAHPALPDAACTTKLVSLLLQQAVEKIDRLRDRAYGLLCSLLCGRQLGLAYAKRRVLHGEAYDALGLVSAVEDKGAGPARKAWPPAQVELLSGCLQPSETVKSEIAGAGKPEADRTAVFDSLTPLLSAEEYRSSLLLGLVVSVGGITEHTAKEAKRALLRHLASETAQQQVCQELLRIFDTAGFKDAAGEAKRLLAPLLNTTGILLSQDCIPLDFARDIFDRTARAVRNSRDIGRLRASVAVFIGLMKWPGSLRREALALLLQFLGFSFPTVRQATAQALYIRLLEEEGDLDLSADVSQAGYALSQPDNKDVKSAIVKAEAVSEAQELVSTTPWATDDEAMLGAALTEVYAKLQMELPTSGRSILVPKKPQEERPREAQYADLVRENHY
ncbi:TBCD [Symbiodinium sp. KB8]|nr:TBCD [Symbiodinium sp. KB8]